MSALAVRDLACSIAGRPHLHGVTCAVAAGEAIALHGPSGSGKSVLLRCLAWLHPIDTGSVQSDGRDPAAWGISRWRARVQWVPQTPRWSAGSVRAVGLRACDFLVHRGLEREVAGERFEDLMAAVGLAVAADQPARRLSGGEQQRLALVRALVLRPAVLLLDEPAAGLDPEAIARVEDLLQRCRDEWGLALVLVSHDGEQRRRLAQRHHDLRDWRVGDDD